MHTGTCADDENGIKRTKSKTEVMYIPGKSKKPPTELKADIPIANGTMYVSYTHQFKYLGSILSDDLRDDADIDNRIAKANAQLGAFGNVFNSSIDMRIKRTMYIQNHINTLLFGCESWTLTADNLRKLEVYHHKALRRILGINMYHVEKFHIRNEHVRNALDIPCITDIIRQGQFFFLGKIARMPETKNQRKIINAWRPVARPTGRPLKTARHTFTETLETVLGRTIMKGDHGCAKDWMPLARDQKTWSALFTKWENSRRKQQLRFDFHEFIDYRHFTLHNRKLDPTAEPFQPRVLDPTAEPFIPATKH